MGGTTDGAAWEAHLAAQGAVTADDRGVRVARHFGDVAAEYRALRDGVALIDVGFRTVVRATGDDRVGFLQGMLTNDVASLAPGQGCGSLLLTVQGRVVADVRVAADATALDLDVDRRVRDAFVAALEKLIIADDVELADATPAVALFGLEGPGAAALAGDVAAALAPYGHATVPICGVPVRCVRASELRGPGLVLHVPAAAATTVWDALRAAGARPCGLDALEARRIEVGVPRVGLDMDEHCLSLEVPVDDLVSFRKGCYLGQEVVARGTARGHVNRKLVGLLLDGETPERGAALLHGDKAVGSLTSVGSSPGLGRVVALGFVRKECWDPGTVLDVAGGAKATVTPWPLA